MLYLGAVSEERDRGAAQGAMQNPVLIRAYAGAQRKRNGGYAPVMGKGPTA